MLTTPGTSSHCWETHIGTNIKRRNESDIVCSVNNISLFIIFHHFLYTVACKNELFTLFKNKRKKCMTDTVTQSLFVTEVQICLNTRIFTRKEITKMEDKWSITRLRIKKIQERFLNLFGFFICMHVWFSDYSMRFTNWAVRKKWPKY